MKNYNVRIIVIIFFLKVNYFLNFLVVCPDK